MLKILVLLKGSFLFDEQAHFEKIVGLAVIVGMILFVFFIGIEIIIKVSKKPRKPDKDA